jgi:IclR family transcriptional regulator, KDG regulon repressor
VVAGGATLGRALDILDLLGGDEAAANGGLGVVRIADLLGREKSQVSRALKTLSARGFVDRDPETREYRLGWRFYGLAARTGRSRLAVFAPALLRELVASLGETAHLSVLDGAEVLTLLSVPSPRLLQASDWSGHRVPAHCTSAGRALLLDEDREALDARFSRTRTRREIDDLERHLGRVRQVGYAVVDGEFEPGLVGVAAPVRDFRYVVAAALNVSGPAFRLGDRVEEAGAAVKRAANELSDRLGAGRGEDDV